MAELPASYSTRLFRDAALPRGRGLWVLAALAAFVIFTVAARLQSPRLPTHVAARNWSEWFLYPAERNPPLQTINCDLNAVHAADEQNIWAVGNLGMIVHSDDGGRTWVKQHIVGPAPTPSVTSTPPASATNVNTATNTNATTGAAGALPNANGATNTNASRTTGGSAPPSSNAANRSGGGAPPQNQNRNTNNRNSDEEFAHAPSEAARDGDEAAPASLSNALPAPEQTGTFEGTVTSRATGEPIAGATVQIFITTNRVISTTTTDARGRFYQGPLVPGRYMIFVSAQGFITQAEEVSLYGGRAVPVTFRLVRSEDAALAATATPTRPLPTPIASSANPNLNQSPTASPPASVTPTASPIAAQSPATQGAVQEDLVAVIFNGTQYGWAASRITSSISATIFSTNDGGNNWYAGRMEIPAGGSREPRAARYIQGTLPILFDLGSSTLVYAQYVLGNDGTFISNPLSISFAISADQLDDLIRGTNFYFLGQGRALAVGERGLIVVAVQQGGGKFLWTPVASGTTADLRAVNSVGDTHERIWVAGDGGTILHSSDGGETWRQQQSGTQARLNGVYFLPNGQDGWAVGYDGLILGTADGGETWARLTQERGVAQAGAYSRSWPPWYYASWLVVGLLLVPAARRPRKEEPKAEESVADVLVSDRPLEVGDPDPLEFRSLALGMSRFLRNEKTVPPLTIAITGEWGTGKSSLMNLLRADLRGWKFRPVWFNAWHHQKEEHLLASLLQNIRLQAVPRWWTPRGISFRAQLLRLRGARHWLPVLVVLFVSAALLAYAYRSRGDLTASFESLKHTVGALFAKGESAGESAGQTAKSNAPLLAFLVSLISLTVTIWKGVTAFGVNPASLLASTSGLRLRDLDAQTSFRQKFASEFADVTRALGVRNMIIFIDDLDRCRPENVLEVLEAVNFLVTSGDCFVVLGMARERVERSVGNSFKDVAEAALADAGVDAKEATAADETTLAGRVEAVRRQTKFARDYLDKLINIEVPVPQPTLDQARELLKGARADAPRESDARRRLKSLGERFGLLLAAAAVLLSGWFWGSGRLGELLRPAATPAPTSVAAQTPVQTVTPTPDPTATPSGVRDTVSSPTRTATPAPTPDENEARKATQKAELIQPTAARRNLTDYWPLFLFVVLAVAACAWLLSRQPGLIVKDSQEFEDALRIWHPVIYSKLRTPRSIKRFMNRVRFLAMRQRRQTERKSYWSQPAAAVKRLFGVKPEETDEPATEEKIPESVLVAFAALQSSLPLLIEERMVFFPFVVNRDERFRASDSPGDTVLRSAIEQHLSTFGSDGFGDSDRMTKYRETFLKLSAGVRVN